MHTDQPTPTAVPDPAPTPATASEAPTRRLRVARAPAPAVPDWRLFLAWPGTTSLVTLLSAACLLGGLWGVLEPTLDDPGRIADRWSVLATVAGYVACLLPAVWAMCRARAGNPDAVAATVTATALAVGYGLVLHLVAPDAPLAGGIAAAIGVLGLAGWWRGWAQAAAIIPSAATAPLAAIIVWAVVWPALLGWRTAVASAVHGGADTPVMAWWTGGWAVLLAILGGMLAAAMGRADPWARRDLPFLSRPAMTWTMALVAAGCAITALGVQAHVAGLDLLRTDLLPHLAILLLVGNELRHRAAGGHAGRDAVVIALPPWLAALFTGGGSDALVRGDGWAPAMLGIVGSPTGLALGLATIGAAMAWRRHAGGLATGAALALSAGVLAWDPHHPLIPESLALGGLVIAVGAWRHRRLDIAATASSGAAALLGASRVIADAVHYPAGTAVYAGCTVALAWAGLRPAAVSASAAQLAAWFLGLLIAGIALAFTAAPSLHLWQAWVAIGLAAPLILWCGWRRRDPLVAAAAAPAIVVVVWPALRLLIPRQRAWLGVWAAFALLGSAVWVAVRRARRP